MGPTSSVRRPKLTSIYPNLSNGTALVLAACDTCGSVQSFNSEHNNRFPDTGYWTECRACGEWRMFYRLAPRIDHEGRIYFHAVNENKSYVRR